MGGGVISDDNLHWNYSCQLIQSSLSYLDLNPKIKNSLTSCPVWSGRAPHRFAWPDVSLDRPLVLISGSRKWCKWSGLSSRDINVTTWHGKLSIISLSVPTPTLLTSLTTTLPSEANSLAPFSWTPGWPIYFLEPIKLESFCSFSLHNVGLGPFLLFIIFHSSSILRRQHFPFIVMAFVKLYHNTNKMTIRY